MDKKKILRILTYTASFILSFVISFNAIKFYKNLRSDITETLTPKEINAPLEIEEKSQINLLLLGYGGPNHDGGYLSDAILVAHIDLKTHKIFMISIPRDIWVPLPIRSDMTQNFKINHAYAIGFADNVYSLKEPIYRGEHGGGNMAKYAMEKITGLPIDYYLAVSFDDFIEIVDILGGITVNVPKTFDDYFYPVKGLENETCGKSPEEIQDVHEKYSGFDLEKQFECRYEHLHFDQGPADISGEQALKFVRSRHSDQHGGDFARHERQQAVIVAVKDKVLKKNYSIDELKELSENIQTDIDQETILKYIGYYKDFANFEILNIRLGEDNVLKSSTSSDGQYILIPKEGPGEWEAIHQLIKTGIEGN